MTGVFSKYIGTPYEKYIRPGIPPGATLAPSSKINPAKRGKIPGLWQSNVWIGWHKGFKDILTMPHNLAAWDNWPTVNVALRGGQHNGVDIDTDDAALADAISAASQRILGPAPVRGRPDSPRCLLVYRLAEGADPIRRRTLAWRMPGDDADLPPEHKLELLGASGHMMIEGVHPSGERYQYRDGKDLIAWGGDNLTAVDEASVNAFFAEAEALIVAAGGIVAQRSIGGAPAGADGRRVIGDPAHLALSTEVASRALHAIPCDELDYDDWIRVTAAFKAATGGADDAREAFVDWSRAYADNTDEAAEDKWNSVSDSALGASWLFAKAAEWGFDEATAMFEPLPGEDAAGDDASADPNTSTGDGATPTVGKSSGDTTSPGGEKPARERWEDRFAYIEPLKEFADLRSPNLQRYDLQAFKLKFPMFSPWAPKSNAVIRYLQSDRKTVCVGYTYLPGQPRIVVEERRRLLNRWSPGLELLDRKISDDEIRPWLDLLKHVIPDPDERAVVLDWLAHLVRRQLPKVNYAILLGGKQGIGKSLLFDPIGRILGRANVRTTSETEIKDKFTNWVAERELVMMEEIRGLSDEVMNRLKMYIAAPPYMVPINEKHVKHYEVPNVARFVAFTNSEYALQISNDDRRWFVIWSQAGSKDPAYYTTFAKWSADNAALVGSWLAQRDLSGFAAQGRAPMTAAKKEMRLAAMGSLDYWVHEAIANGQTPFETDLVSVEDVLSRLPYELRNLRPTPTEKSIAIALKTAGARKLARVSLGKPLDTTCASRTVLWAVRRQAMLKDLNNERLAELFWKQRAERIDGQGFENLDDQLKKAG